MTSNATGRTPVMESKIPRETRRIIWNIADFAEIKDTDDLVDKLGITFEMGHQIGIQPVQLKAYLRVRQDEGAARKWIGWWCKAVGAQNNSSKIIGKATVKVGNLFTVRNRTPKNLRTSYGWRRLIPQNVALSSLPLDAEGTLPIEITMTLYNTEGTHFPVNDLMAKFQGRFSRKLSEDMEMLYKEPCVLVGAPPTVMVVARDGRAFPANWSNLAARSPVFRLMFQTPMTEAAKSVVKMEDIGGDSLEVFLHFLHTATLKENWKEPGVLEELVHVAHKHTMKDLLAFLDKAIELVCPFENCANMIRIAHRLELKKAKKALLKMYQEQWKQVTDVDEMMELFQK